MAAAAAPRTVRAMMGLWPWAAAIVAVACALAPPGASAATIHVVGDSTGWIVPPSTSFYADWASKQTFAVGDTLVFNFTTGSHNVIRVPKSDYDACTFQNSIGATMSTGPATVSLDSTGVHYYLCGVGPHCSLGQKVAITVASSGGAASPSPAPTTGGSVPSSSAPARGFRVAAGFSMAALAAGACLF